MSLDNNVVLHLSGNQLPKLFRIKMKKKKKLFTSVNLLVNIISLIKSK